MIEACTLHNGDVLFPQAIVAIAGKEARVKLINAGTVKIGIKAFPDCIEPLHMFVDGDDFILTILGKTYHPEVDHAVFTVGEGDAIREVSVPVRTFTDREFFVVFCLGTNFHKGWDPSWLPQYYPELANGEPGFVARKRANKVGPGVFGSAYSYLYDATQAKEHGITFTPIERILHERQIPITWLVDTPVAERMAGSIKTWHELFGDTFSILPTSFFQDNCVNYNIQKTADDARALLADASAGVSKAFNRSGYPAYASVAGVDQWTGSIGTNFVRAALALGFKGLWGMGWDQERGDAGMHHRGAPWDAYKPSKLQFRIPARENERFELFLFPWTTRDLVNALHLSPQGSAVYSTDPHELRSSGILEQVKPHYMAEMLFDYLKNMKYNDHFIFIVHQQDHDAHHEEENMYIKLFLDAVFEERYPGLTFATLEEVAQWLAIKYPDNDVPFQVLELEDPLDPRLRATIRERRGKAIREVYDPANDDELARILATHFPDTRLPRHLCYHDRYMLFLSYQPHRLPVQMWDYRRREEWGVPEEGQYPLTILPKITVTSESTSDGYRLKLVSDKFFSNLPWIVWDPPFKLDPAIERGHAIATDHAIVFFLNVQAGENEYDLSYLLQGVYEKEVLNML
ncbi:MAG: hypothetical protein GYA24_24160 [Candidatus Lokiarchaeota archaeon]|nr:hypothetical protein [Candidatus Lokiarchaeota archaeon]